MKAREVRPNDPEVYAQLARFYEARGQFDKQMEALYMRAEKEPNNPEAYHTIAAVYWNKACLPARPQCNAIAAPTSALKAKYIQAGLEAEEKALGLRDDYIDALSTRICSSAASRGSLKRAPRAGRRSPRRPSSSGEGPGNPEASARGRPWSEARSEASQVTGGW